MNISRAAGKSINMQISLELNFTIYFNFNESTIVISLVERVCRWMNVCRRHRQIITNPFILINRCIGIINC